MQKITVATITYNRVRLLERTIKCVLEQSFTDFEYLIINNGSTDETASLIERYQKADSRIRVASFDENRRDSASAANRYRLIAENEKIPYFMMIDDDDYMELNTIETLYSLITWHDADAACVGCRYVYPDGSTRDKFVFDGVFVYSRIEAMVEMLKREKFNASIGNKLFHKSTLHDITLPPVNQSRDVHTAYRRMNNVNKMVVTGIPLYYYYRHDKNSSGLDTEEQITPEKLRQHLEANEVRTKWLTEHMPEIKDFVFYCELSFMISLWERIHRLDVQPCFEIADEMKMQVLQNINFLSEHDFCTEREKQILVSMKI